jgi:hypothetical protein
MMGWDIKRSKTTDIDMGEKVPNENILTASTAPSPS